MAPNFRQRPLRNTTPERRLFVNRAEEVRKIGRALDLHFNVVLVGERGVGATTLLNKVAWTRPKMVNVSGESCTSAQELLNNVARELAQLGSDVSPLTTDESMEVIQGNSGRETVISLDGVDPVVGHEVFGRMRERLWELDPSWLTATNAADVPTFLAPPADGFFDVVLELSAMGADELIQLLARRDEDGQLTPATQRQIAESSRGNPAEALRLARAILISGKGALDRAADETLIDRIETEIGRPAARLARELQRSGPLGPSDDELRDRLGWSKPRAYEVFRELENQGFASRSEARSGRVGRPRSVFALIEPKE